MTWSPIKHSNPHSHLELRSQLGLQSGVVLTQRAALPRSLGQQAVEPARLGVQLAQLLGQRLRLALLPLQPAGMWMHIWAGGWAVTCRWSQGPGSATGMSPTA